MSSTTSMEAGGIRPWHLFVVFAMLAASAAVLMARDTSLANLILISLTVFSAGWAGLLVLRTLWPLVAEHEEEFSPTVSSRARMALEREKQLVLRSIKELEFDRAMGKVADADFSEMVGRLRARAVGIMKQLDERPETYREQIEREVLERLEALHQAAPTGGSAGGAAADAGGAVAGGGAGAAVFCTQCGTRNDGDAKFCKACGRALG